MYKNKYKIISFYFTRDQLKGLGYFVLLLFTLQLVYFFLKKTFHHPILIDKQQMEAVEKHLSVMREQQNKNKEKYDKFNPNYISDEKGFSLGMTLQQIDRLHKFREQKKFINSIKEFQDLTKVSDQWINRNKNKFKFPDWVNQKQKTKFKITKTIRFSTNDINKIEVEELVKIKGVGEKTALRIVNERKKLGGFVSIEQLSLIDYVSPMAVYELKKYFKVRKKTLIHKININTASIDELSNLPYFNKYLARKVVVARSKRNEPLQQDDIGKIIDLSPQKVRIISLYLMYNK